MPCKRTITTQSFQYLLESLPLLIEVVGTKMFEVLLENFFTAFLAETVQRKDKKKMIKSESILVEGNHAQAGPLRSLLKDKTSA